MADAPYRVAHVSEIVSPRREPGEAPWRAVRRHFGIGSFGVTAYIAERRRRRASPASTPRSDSGHEELFFVARGHAAISVGGESVEAPAGTFVYVPDPASCAGATALEAGTTLLAVGGEPGKAFEVSSWEKQAVRRSSCAGLERQARARRRRRRAGRPLAHDRVARARRPARRCGSTRRPARSRSPRRSRERGRARCGSPTGARGTLA